MKVWREVLPTCLKRFNTDFLKLSKAFRYTSRRCTLSAVWRSRLVAEGGGLLNRYRGVNPYRGFESLLLRQSHKEPAPLAGSLTLTITCEVCVKRVRY